MIVPFAAVMAAASLAALAPPVITAFPSAQGTGGGRGGVQQDREVIAEFDEDGDERLNAAERAAARRHLEALGAPGGGRVGFGRGRFDGVPADIRPGPAVSPDRVKTYPASVDLYDLDTLRTLFFEFENEDWERELMVFKDTDVEVPATLIIDGQRYSDVGVSFRGASSFRMVPEGQKHSLNVTVDFADEKQAVGGYRTLNLLNGHEDPILLRAVLFLQAARDHAAAARANFARVVINGESWGIYTNVEQVNKDFVARAFGSDKGARWKVPGSPNGRGGLEYIGEDIEPYRRIFDIKSKDNPEDWAALVSLTKVLNETPTDQLETALGPILDVDGVLRFLALDNVLVNNDGYWVRASDYYLYRDPDGRFHVVPSDVNETFPAGGGRGGRGRGVAGAPPPPTGGGDVVVGRGGRRGGFGGGSTVTLDLLVGLDDPSKPLRSKLLAVPALRARYLEYAREIATRWLDWNTLGPLVTSYQALIAADVETDTRKLASFQEFQAGVGALKRFADERRAFVLQASGPVAEAQP
jgi:hypothetical protein